MSRLFWGAFPDETMTARLVDFLGTRADAGCARVYRRYEPSVREARP